MKTAIVIVDVQNDFYEKNGALSVPNAHEIMEVIDKILYLNYPVFLTRDWHPEDHCSFKENGGTWPSHCVQNTWGADISGELKVLLNKHNTHFEVISKGMDKNKEEYSGATRQLIDRLKELDIELVYVCGLATDYCVIATAEGLEKQIANVNIIFNGCKHVFDSNLSDFITRCANSDIGIRVF